MSRFRHMAGLVLWLATTLSLSAPVAAQHAVPVLCYHGFVEAGEPVRGELTEPFDRFEATLRFMAEQGFRSVFPDEVAAGSVAPERAVIITFDDGRREQMQAAEMLEQYGFRGLFFVIPARLADEHPHYLSRDDVARLVRAGHRVAPHGYAHRSLVASGREVAASLTRATDRVHAFTGASHSIADFAFPFGHYGDEVVEALVHEYDFLHTVNPGYWDGESPLVPRMLIARDTPLQFYTDYLIGAADYRPTAHLLTADGGAGGEAMFTMNGVVEPQRLEMLVISADRDGHMYATHPLADNVRLEDDVLVVDVRAHLERHYPEDRDVVSYALVTRDGHGLHYVSPGHLQWLK